MKTFFLKTLGEKPSREFYKKEALVRITIETILSCRYFLASIYYQE